MAANILKPLADLKLSQEQRHPGTAEVGAMKDIMDCGLVAGQVRHFVKPYPKYTKTYTVADDTIIIYGYAKHGYTAEDLSQARLRPLRKDPELHFYRASTPLNRLMRTVIGTYNKDLNAWELVHEREYHIHVCGVSKKDGSTFNLKDSDILKCIDFEMKPNDERDESTIKHPITGWKPYTLRAAALAMYESVIRRCRADILWFDEKDKRVQPVYDNHLQFSEKNCNRALWLINYSIKSIKAENGNASWETRFKETLEAMITTIRDVKNKYREYGWLRGDYSKTGQEQLLKWQAQLPTLDSYKNTFLQNGASAEQKQAAVVGAASHPTGSAAASAPIFNQFRANNVLPTFSNSEQVKDFLNGKVEFKWTVVKQEYMGQQGFLVGISHIQGLPQQVEDAMQQFCQSCYKYVGIQSAKYPGNPKVVAQSTLEGVVCSATWLSVKDLQTLWTHGESLKCRACYKVCPVSPNS